MGTESKQNNANEVVLIKIHSLFIPEIVLQKQYCYNHVI